MNSLHNKYTIAFIVSLNEQNGMQIASVSGGGGISRVGKEVCGESKTEADNHPLTA